MMTMTLKGQVKSMANQFLAHEITVNNIDSDQQVDYKFELMVSNIPWMKRT